MARSWFRFPVKLLVLEYQNVKKSLTNTPGCVIFVQASIPRTSFAQSKIGGDPPSANFAIAYLKTHKFQPFIPGYFSKFEDYFSRCSVSSLSLKLIYSS